ncbi:MAG: carbohydrate binding domain-containing protein [Pseudobdellovibrionaceae bacterium]
MSGSFFGVFIFTIALSFFASAQTVPIGTSLLKDGGFESGFTFWTVDMNNSSLNTTTPLFGTQSLRLGASTGGRGQIITSGIEPGAKYRLSGYAAISSTNDVATLGVEFQNSQGVNIIDQWTQVQGNVAKLYSFDVQIPYGTTTILVYAFKNQGTLPVDLDNIDFVKLSGP